MVTVETIGRIRRAFWVDHKPIRQIDARCAALARSGLGVLDRPARVAVLLAQLGRAVRPSLGNAALSDVALLAVGVALRRCGDDRGVDDLAAHRQKPGRRERPSEALEQHLDRRFAGDPGPGQCLAEFQIVLAARASAAARVPEVEGSWPSRRVGRSEFWSVCRRANRCATQPSAAPRQGHRMRPWHTGAGSALRAVCRILAGRAVARSAAM